MTDHVPYAARQAALHAAYCDAFRAHFASLSPEDREAYEAAGITEPLDDGPIGGGGLDHDLAEDPRASEEIDYAGSIDAAEIPDGRRAEYSWTAAEREAEIAERCWDIVRRLIGILQGQDNVKLAIDCYALASGVSFLGNSQVEIAKKHALHRAAVAKRCVELTKDLGLPPSRFMRPVIARRSYSSARNRRIQMEEQAQCKQSN